MPTRKKKGRKKKTHIAAQAATPAASESSTPETKEQKFVRLAEKRTTRAINALRSVRKLSNRASYQYTDDDVAIIHSALEAEVKELGKAFASHSGKQSDVFKLRKTEENDQ